MNTITKNILEWHEQIDRDLPWKQTDDPYFIWLSEIIMQQTRVAQGTPYYLKFVRLFPTVHDLAQATQEEVFKAWEGLGYYSRARNLHAAAKYISETLQGVFPTTYESILELKGVGPYTAAAIASFAFNEDKAVLDGNVFRVLSRLFDLDLDILSSHAKKEFSQLAMELLPLNKAAAWNQAIMDFGALQCTPKNPNCLFCPVVHDCLSHARGSVHLRPVKKKAAKKKHRYFHFLDTSALGYYLVQKRETKDVWEGLHQFPLIENAGEIIIVIKEWTELEDILGKIIVEQPIELKQTLSHQIIHGFFYKISSENQKEFQDIIAKGNIPFLQVESEEIRSYGFPRLITKYLGA